jgi:hypothetical protein
MTLIPFQGRPSGSPLNCFMPTCPGGLYVFKQFHEIAAPYLDLHLLQGA